MDAVERAELVREFAAAPLAAAPGLAATLGQKERPHAKLLPDLPEAGHPVVSSDLEHVLDAAGCGKPLGPGRVTAVGFSRKR